MESLIGLILGFVAGYLTVIIKDMIAEKRAIQDEEHAKWLLEMMKKLCDGHNKRINYGIPRYIDDFRDAILFKKRNYN